MFSLAEQNCVEYSLAAEVCLSLWHSAGLASYSHFVLKTHNPETAMLCVPCHATFVEEIPPVAEPDGD